MSDDEDPEVVADLKLRAATEHDRTRNRGDMPKYVPAKIVDRVPCRNRCGAVVAWSEEAESTFETFNKQLARKMEAPLDKTKIVFCGSCRAKGGEMRAAENRKQVDFIANLIRELKGGVNSERHNEIIAKLKKAGHPDTEGLEQALREKIASKPGKRFTRGSL